MTTLECLPNEILLELFEYLNSADLLYGFHRLNHRFTYLLYHQFRCYYLDLYSMSKQKTDMIYRQHLPFISNRVVKLHLAEIGDIPQQINYFFSYTSSLSPFDQLRSLSVTHVYSSDTLLKILDECQHLNQLTHLHLRFSYFLIRRTTSELHLDKIWSLPKLTHLEFSIYMPEQKFFLPTKISSTLKFINRWSLALSWSELDQLFKCTPHLEHLSIKIKFMDNYDLIPTPPSTLVKLTIIFFRSSDISEILLFLQKISNVRHLTIRLMSKLINGNQWEQLIRHHLLKLKTFHLNMTYEFDSNINIQDQADQLIDTFRSSFWIEEHQWFVRYHLLKNELHLFTLSNAFYYYNKKLPDVWKSTDPNDNNQAKFYSHRRRIHDEKFFNQSFTFDLRLSKIHSLSIEFPINEQFWSIILGFKCLSSLRIFSYNDTFQLQLQTIIDQAPKLRHLTIYEDESLPLQMSLFKLTNLSIDDITFKNYQFNEEECIILSQSHLVKNCQTLSVRVKNYQSIVILVQNLINLQMLYVRYDKKIEFQTNNDGEVVEWLKDRLPSACLITKHPTTVNILQIWI